MEPKREHLDLRGEVCPYTFVRTKLALEELDDDAELTIVVDHRPAFTSVPRSLAQDGHAVLAVEPAADASLCTIVVRKQTPSR